MVDFDLQCEITHATNLRRDFSVRKKLMTRQARQRRLLVRGYPTAAHDQIIVVKDASLPRGDRALRDIQLD